MSQALLYPSQTLERQRKEESHPSFASKAADGYV